MQAAQLGHTAVVRELLLTRSRRGANPNDGLAAGPFGLLATESPLAVAAARGHTATVVALLEGGADPDLGWSLGHDLGAASSPLAFAVDREHTAVIETLLDRGASPDLGREIGPGASRILPSRPVWRLERGSPRRVALARTGGLLYAGTPLHTAARDDRTSAVAALLFDPKTQSKRGKDEKDRRSPRKVSPDIELLSGALMGIGGTCPPRWLRAERPLAQPRPRFPSDLALHVSAAFAGETARGVASRLGHSRVLELLTESRAHVG